MSLTPTQKTQTAQELQANYARLAYDTARVLKDLQIDETTLHSCLTMSHVQNPAHVWQLRDYLIDKLTQENKEIVPFTVLDDPSKNKWFQYKKTW